MINLLPGDYKEDISYARRNTVIRKWIILSLASLAGIGIIVAGGWLYMQQSIDNLDKQLNSSRQELERQKVSDTQKKVEDISSNTKLAIQVLSREILFSKLLKQIGSTLPNNTALKALQIDNTQGGLQLDAEALDFNAATQLQVNLQDPKNGVFEKADINNIVCKSSEDTAQGETASLFPCTVSVRALFGKNTTYNYIAPGVVKQ